MVSVHHKLMAFSKAMPERPRYVYVRFQIPHVHHEMQVISVIEFMRFPILVSGRFGCVHEVIKQMNIVMYFTSCRAMRCHLRQYKLHMN